MELIENPDAFSAGYSSWNGGDDLAGYRFVENINAPFSPVRRALPMMNLAIISSAGAYIEGTLPFQLAERDGDTSFREIPVEVDAADLRFAAKGYNAEAVLADRNSQIPIERLLEYEQNSVIGHLNDVWWSLSSHIPNAIKVADEISPRIVERLERYQIQGALLIPASRLCHQTLGIIARGIDNAGIPSIVVSVDREVTDKVRPPRTAFYNGEFGSVAGKANWPEFQRRVLDETLRGMETFDQPGTRKLAVDIETQVEAARGER